MSRAMPWTTGRSTSLCGPAISPRVFMTRPIRAEDSPPSFCTLWVLPSATVAVRPER